MLVTGSITHNVIMLTDFYQGTFFDVLYQEIVQDIFIINCVKFFLQNFLYNKKYPILEFEITCA